MKASNLGVAVVALVIGVGIGLLIGKGPSDPCLTPGDHLIDVGQNGSLTCPVAVLQRGTTHRITWSSPPGTTLRIVFRSTSVPQAVCPAPNSTANTCIFGPVNANVPASPPDGDIYDVTVTGGTAPPPPGTNGRIIIKK